MPAAIVENATTSAQRKIVGTVESLPAQCRDNIIKSPALIIIGEVCRLSGRYDWFSQKPLFGKRIIVARAKPGMSRLSDMLKASGGHVIELPCAKITPLTAPGCFLEGAIRRINEYTWLVFTSTVGVNVFFDYLIESGFDIRALYHLKVACVGAETEKEINKRGIKADYRPAEYNGAALARGLAKLIKDNEKLLIARAKDGAEELTRILTDKGIGFDDAPIYEKTRTGGQTIIDNVDFVAFTSSSSVEWFVESSQNPDYGKMKAVCIGERTAAAARSYGMHAYVSSEAVIDSMVEKIKELACGGF